MKKIIFSLFALISVSAFAQTNGLKLSTPEGAQIQFVEETIDYGTIEQYADGNRSFVFKNTGKEPLIISSCSGSCGCTVPKCPTEPIMPGETAKINVKYATDRLGQFTKTVTINSNSSGDPVKVVQIKGNVIPKEGGSDANH